MTKLETKPKKPFINFGKPEKREERNLKTEKQGKVYEKTDFDNLTVTAWELASDTTAREKAAVRRDNNNNEEKGSADVKAMLPDTHLHLSFLAQAWQIRQEASWEVSEKISKKQDTDKGWRGRRRRRPRAIQSRQVTKRRRSPLFTPVFTPSDCHIFICIRAATEPDFLEYPSQNVSQHIQ